MLEVIEIKGESGECFEGRSAKLSPRVSSRFINELCTVQWVPRIITREEDQNES